MKKVMIQYDNGLWVPKDMCTINRFGEADDCASCKEVCKDLDGDCEECPVQDIFSRLAEYEDLEEQGKLLKLPCSVGDKIYRIDTDEKIENREIEFYDIDNISILSDGTVLLKYDAYDGVICELENIVSDKPYLDFYRCFLTHQEAEDKLAEMDKKEGTHAEEKEQPETE